MSYHIICEYFCVSFKKTRTSLFKHKHKINTHCLSRPHQRVTSQSYCRMSSRVWYFPNCTVNGFYSLFLGLRTQASFIHKLIDQLLMSRFIYRLSRSSPPHPFSHKQGHLSSTVTGFSSVGLLITFQWCHLTCLFLHHLQGLWNGNYI